MPKFTKRAIHYGLTDGPTLIIKSFAFNNRDAGIGQWKINKTVINDIIFYFDNRGKLSIYDAINNC